MSKPVRLVPGAEDEYLSAIAWYEGQRAGLGEELVLAVDEALARLQPTGLWPVIANHGGHEVRQALVRRFPYRVVFMELAEEIRVLAVAHSSREPSYWAVRG